MGSFAGTPLRFVKKCGTALLQLARGKTSDSGRVFRGLRYARFGGPRVLDCKDGVTRQFEF
jgi:hypothetical protein